MKKLIILLALSLYCVGVQAQNTLAGNLTVQQTVKLLGTSTPAQLTANVNDYAPTGFGTASTVRLSSDNLRTVTGLAGGAAGRTVTLMNIGEFAITLATESTSSMAGNRFALGSADFTLAKGSALTLWYDGTSSRWRATSNTVVDGAAVDQVARDAAAAAQATANSKQDALANTSTLAKITEAAGLPLWDGGTWPGGGGGGTGTVTSVSVTTANGISGTVTNPTTTPAISLTLGAIAPTSVAASGTVTGSNLSGTNTGDQTSVAGNAGTATALQTARTINGVSFDGTANITVPAAAGTLTGSTLASGVTASSLTSAAGGTFGTAAFTAATAYDPAGAAAAITLAGLGGVPTSRTVNGHALSSNVSVTAGDVGLGSVENTALSTWAGTPSITTLGTITAGTWHGTAIADTYIASAAAWNAKVSFPGFGTTGTTAAVGNDSRLSDARTPLAHTQTWSTITTTPTTLAGYGITDAQGLDSDLTALAGLSTTGFVARTGAGTAATRTITGTTDQVVVTNGDGVSGNPTLALPQSIATTSTPQFAGLNLMGTQTIDTGTGSLPTVLTNTSFRMARADTQGARFEGVGFASAGITFSGRSAGGTRASPSATSNDMLFLTAHGYDGTGWVAASKGAYRIGPNGTWSGTNNGTYHAWVGVPKGSTTSADWMDLRDGALAIGGTASATNKLFVNSLDASRVFFAGTTKGIRFTHNSIGSSVEGVDNTGSASYQPLYLGGSSLVMTISGGETARLTSSGLGIGTDAPNQKVTVGGVGTFGYGIQQSDTTVAAITANTSTGEVQHFSTTNYFPTFYSNNVERMRISTSGGVRFNAYGAGTLVTDSSGNITASSDRRLKNVGAKFARGLDDVVKIQPRFYTWKPESGMNPDDVNVGFIAQDVQDAIPEAVGSMKTSDTEEDDAENPGKKAKKTKREAAEFLTLSDRPIIAALVNAVKELKAKNDELEARIAKLEAKK